YWGDTPALDRITFLSIVEDGTRVALLEAGEVDVITSLPPADIDRLRLSPSYVVLAQPSTRVIHIGINTTKVPFDDERVRQARNYAIDREGLVAGVLRGIGEPAQSIISPI